MQVSPKIKLKPKLRYRTPSPPRPESPIDIDKMSARRLEEEERMDFNPKLKLRCVLFNHLHVEGLMQKRGLLLNPQEIIFSAKGGEQKIYRLWIPHDSKEITFQKTLAPDLGDEFVGGGVEVGISTMWSMLVNEVVEFAVIASAKAFSKTAEELVQEVVEAKWWVDESKFGGQDLLETLSGMEIDDVQKLIAYVAKWKFDKNGKPRSDEDAMLTKDCLDVMWPGADRMVWGWLDETIHNENGSPCE